MSIEDILEYLKESKSDFEKEFGIDKMAVFGSYARGDNSISSDIDIIYSLKEGKKLSFDRYLELEERLQNRFDSKIDLINEKRLNPLVRIYAQREFIYV